MSRDSSRDTHTHLQMMDRHWQEHPQLFVDLDFSNRVGLIQKKKKKQDKDTGMAVW